MSTSVCRHVLIGLPAPTLVHIGHISVHIGLSQIGLRAPTLVLAFLLYVSSAAHIGHISVHIGLLQIGLPATTLVLALPYMFTQLLLYVCLRTDLEIGLPSGAVMALRDACEVSCCLFFLFLLSYGVEGRVRGQSLPLFFPSFFSWRGGTRARSAASSSACVLFFTCPSTLRPHTLVA